MKRLAQYLAILFLLLLSGVARAAPLTLHAKYDDGAIRLKWIAQAYSDTQVCKLYRSSPGQAEELIATLGPAPAIDLLAMGFNQEFVEFIHPYSAAKTPDERLAVAKTAAQAQGFRVMKAMQDNQFARLLGQYYVDSSLRAGQTYRYRVELLREPDAPVQASSELKAAPVRTGAVKWLQARNVEAGIALTWDTSSAAPTYALYRKRDSEPAFTRVSSLMVDANFASGNKQMFLDDKLAAGEKAAYQVRAIDLFADEGKPSQPATARRLLIAKTPAVGPVWVKAGARKITLRWGITDPALAYNVYRSVNYSGGYRKLNAAPIRDAAYFDADIVAGQKYYYRVTATSPLGESAPSASMLAYARDTIPPDAPGDLKSSVKPGEAHLQWRGVKSPDLLGYRVYQSMDAQAESWALINKTELAESHFLHVQAKTLSRFPYFYRVTAVDKTFNESAPSNVVEVRFPDVTVPAQPVLERSVIYPGKIVLHWNYFPDHDFSHYNVYRKRGASWLRLNESPLAHPTFSDPRPDSGSNVYAVTAIDRAGNESDKQKTLSAQAYDNLPVTLDKFVAKPGNAGIELSFVSSSADYNGFEVYRKQGDAPAYDNISGFQKGTRFLDKSALPNQPYYYLIKAFDRAGNVQESRVVQATQVARGKAR